MAGVSRGDLIAVEYQKITLNDNPKSKWLGKYDDAECTFTAETGRDMARRTVERTRLPEIGGELCTHKDAPSVNGITGVDVRYVVSAAGTAPAITIRYRSDDWIFWGEAYVMIDGVRFAFAGLRSEVHRDVLSGGRGVSEWLCLPSLGKKHGDAVLGVLAAMREAALVELVLIGDAHRLQVTLPAETLDRMRETISAAEADGWKP